MSRTRWPKPHGPDRADEHKKPRPCRPGLSWMFCLLVLTEARPKAFRYQVSDVLLALQRGDRRRSEAILVVDVVAELHAAIRRRPSRDINPVTRHRIADAGIDALARGDDLIDLGAIPAGGLLQQPG